MKFGEVAIILFLLLVLAAEIVVAYIVYSQPDVPTGLNAVGVGSTGLGDIGRPESGDCEGNCLFCGLHGHSTGYLECRTCYHCDHGRYVNITGVGGSD